MRRTIYYALLLVIIIPYTTIVHSKNSKNKNSIANQKATVIETMPEQVEEADDTQISDNTGEDVAVSEKKGKKSKERIGRPAAEEMFAEEEEENKPKRSSAQAASHDGFPTGLKGEESLMMSRMRTMIVDLVKEGKQFFLDNSLDVTCQTMIKTKKFTCGEVYVFVFDFDGYCLAQGQETSQLWQDFKDVKDEYGSVFVLDFIEKAKAGGGWVAYRYRNASKVAYVELIEKYGKQYLIGAGFYPHSKVYACMNLVKGAVRFFQDSEAKNLEYDSIFSTLSYPAGRFVSGDLYIFALDEKGTLVVQGDRPTLVGSNVLMMQDAKGQYINKDIIDRLHDTNEGVWVEYISRNALKRVYAERVTGKNGKNFYIACGYYPDTTREKVISIVQEGYRHMKKGAEQAFRDIDDRRDTIFHYGDIDLEVYNMKGVCVAHGTDPDYVGRSFYNEKDETGSLYMQKLLDIANKDGKGWINHKTKNAYEWIYFEKINVGLEEYVITGALFPISKREAMELLAKDAVEFIQESKEVKYAFSEFVKRTGRFSLGDLEVFVFEQNGICAVYGSQTEDIWQSMLDAKDEAGRPYVKLFINAARRTPARVVYKMNGANALAYVERVEKDGLTFFVGSSYYTYNNLDASGKHNTDKKVSQNVEKKVNKKNKTE